MFQRNDVIKVVPGMKIPVDGIVINGTSQVDESMVTGESEKIPKFLGSQVFGGSMNSSGVLLVRVSKMSTESTLFQILKFVELAQTSRPPIQRLSDKISSWFIPVIFGLSFSVFFVWLGVVYSNSVQVENYGKFPFCLQFFIAVLVVSCPCAIALAVPGTIMIGSGVASKHGILFKNAGQLETCHRVNAVVFDKTGTLTKGRHHVTAVLNFGEISLKTALRLIASAEMSSQHSLAKAVVRYAEESKIEEFLQVENFEEFAGRGLTCIIDGQNIAVGKRSWMSERAIFFSKEAEEAASRLEGEGSTVICLSVNGQLETLISLKDELRPEASSVIFKLKEMGIQVWMMTGDNLKVAERVAAELGIPNFEANMMPQDKMSQIEKLQKQGHIVAMIGDGINDSPALSQSDAGMAVSSGTDFAMEAASVVLMKDDLRDIVIALEISKKVFRHIQINFIWAFLYNVIAIPLAAGVLYPIGVDIPPGFAGLAELVSSVPVVVMPFWLHTYKPHF
eukprot:TRINITY_DN2262_c0_g3_i1.p1 TRINITY_DN2262_c0_g3~~TRINITY_DN2262_c0_g3_i1.p1  ORF type:complete len:507 (+),score=197.47 TRINITY_DN2262_c0_g3_i1:158-1678(+)